MIWAKPAQNLSKSQFKFHRDMCHLHIMTLHRSNSFACPSALTGNTDAYKQYSAIQCGPTTFQSRWTVWKYQGVDITSSHLICNHFSWKGYKSGSRKVVWEIWFKKSGSRKVVDQKKKVVLYHKSTFFQVGKKWLTRKKKSEFAEPLFYSFLEKWLQIKCSKVFLWIRFSFW